MIIITRLTKYTPEVAQRTRELLIELSRSGKDKGEIPREWFEDVISSPFHDMILAFVNDELMGVATLSIINGPGARKSVYLEDFVVSDQARGRGLGKALWQEMLKWGKEKGAEKLVFTCGQGREAAQEFYKKQGAEIYDTNFFRFKLEG